MSEFEAVAGSQQVESSFIDCAPRLLNQYELDALLVTRNEEGIAFKKLLNLLICLHKSGKSMMPRALVIQVLLFWPPLSPLNTIFRMR